MYIKNNARRKGKGSNSRPTSFSTKSNCTTSKLLKAIKGKEFTKAADILEESGIVGEVALLYIGLLDLRLRGVK
jgi:hypothetical protein